MTVFATAGADIAHERVDDEVIVINLATGAYFSLTGAAADYWTLLAAGTALAAVTDAMTDRYDVDSATVENDVEALLARLIEEGLLSAVPVDKGRVIDLPQAQGALAYRSPTLDKYDDMEELLLLDPVHEVDAAGWPLVPTEPA